MALVSARDALGVFTSVSNFAKRETGYYCGCGWIYKCADRHGWTHHGNSVMDSSIGRKTDFDKPSPRAICNMYYGCVGKDASCISKIKNNSDRQPRSSIRSTRNQSACGNYVWV